MPKHALEYDRATDLERSDPWGPIATGGKRKRLFCTHPTFLTYADYVEDQSTPCGADLGTCDHY